MTIRRALALSATLAALGSAWALAACGSDDTRASTVTDASTRDGTVGDADAMDGDDDASRDASLPDAPASDGAPDDASDGSLFDATPACDGGACLFSLASDALAYPFAYAVDEMNVYFGNYASTTKRDLDAVTIDGGVVTVLEPGLPILGGAAVDGTEPLLGRPHRFDRGRKGHARRRGARRALRRGQRKRHRRGFDERLLHGPRGERLAGGDRRRRTARDRDESSDAGPHRAGRHRRLLGKPVDEWRRRHDRAEGGLPRWRRAFRDRRRTLRPDAIAIGGGRIYWGATDGTVRSASLAGPFHGGSGTLVASQPGQIVTSVAVDGTSLYYAVTPRGQAAPGLTGGIVVVALATGESWPLVWNVDQPVGLLLDAKSIYWSTQTSPGAVYRVAK